jgi:hypothetical protein
MDDNEKARFAQLPAFENIFRAGMQRQRLKKKFISLIGSKDFDDLLLQQAPLLLNYYQAIIMSELISYGVINVAMFTHEIQDKIAHDFSPLEFDAACRIVYDWCTTGGVNAAKIGEGLE